MYCSYLIVSVFVGILYIFTVQSYLFIAKKGYMINTLIIEMFLHLVGSVMIK